MLGEAKGQIEFELRSYLSRKEVIANEPICLVFHTKEHEKNIGVFKDRGKPTFTQQTRHEDMMKYELLACIRE